MMVTSGSSDTPRVILFGDSIAMGLGVRRCKYGALIADGLSGELIDYSQTGWTITQSLAAYLEAPQAGDVAVIAHGITEPILRPVLPSWVPLPRRWRRLGWMDPRPYFSTRTRRRVLETIESALRWRVKNVLMRAFGSHQLASLETFARDLERLKSECEARGARVVILGPPDIDERFFPGSVYEQLRYSRVSERIGGVEYLPIAGAINRWGDYLLDHFHPNDDGHEAIARVVLLHLMSDNGSHADVHDAVSVAPHERGMPS
ncbi:SGNH/GDSL hydrolase family protein [Microbacterium sp. CFBP 13617]|uniref:SGNH/GDSL hydrolase family protein n=1 Tax=Microbacterium sp. CFBP 13617 TaxID=2774035 RepID=UPI001780C120|nr:SGNH/GDSL hydrolase family protein [Microbacterium sp. CFBP 13617]MBD8218526.1 SGNH/GDSL hydrolase family protein [Microbacterium sp. CFBP 13617]